MGYIEIVEYFEMLLRELESQKEAMQNDDNYTEENIHGIQVNIDFVKNEIEKAKEQANNERRGL